MIYFFISFMATVLGAIAGLGGGIIIKPLMDLLSTYNASTIGLLSSICVLIMSIISLFKNISSNFEYSYMNIALLSIGSLLGGYIGNYILYYLTFSLDDNTIKLIQNILLIIQLIFVLLYMNIMRKSLSFNVNNKIFILFIGLFLGTISTFLGIGGGPINLAIFCLFFSMEIKDATINSIAIVLSSQLSKLFIVAVSENIFNYDLHIIFFMLPGAILGGYIGSWLNKIINSKSILNIYNLSLLFVIFITSINIFNYFPS